MLQGENESSSLAFCWSAHRNPLLVCRKHWPYSRTQTGKLVEENQLTNRTSLKAHFIIFNAINAKRLCVIEKRDHHYKDYDDDHFVFWVRRWRVTLSSRPKPLRQLRHGELRMKHTRVHTRKAAVWCLQGWKSLNLCSSVLLNLLLWPNRQVRTLWKCPQNLQSYREMANSKICCDLSIKQI